MKVLAFGEILFDCYPTQTKIGGAPFNFCAHLAKLGADCTLYSAIGTDELGAKALSSAKKYGVDTRFLKQHPTLPTGVCRVSYCEGEPRYDLSGCYAYDEIPCEEKIFVERYDIFYFGTLALRNEISKKTWEELVRNRKFDLCFFDMNLRQHYYSEKLIQKGLSVCDIVKMNREEFFYVKEISNSSESDIALSLKKICQLYQIETAILTLDKDGACVWNETEGFLRVPAVPTEFVSAVGAGDSFCACFLYHYIKGHSLEICLEKASRLAGFVVSQEEAIPVYSQDFLKILQNI